MVSIHAPARGATVRGLNVTFIALFQFTLPRGERQSLSHHYQPLGRFQFTLPRGERLPPDTLTCPARSFNSRSREGSDPNQLNYL